jgi:hypothetical protein
MVKSNILQPDQFFKQMKHYTSYLKDKSGEIKQHYLVGKLRITKGNNSPEYMNH